MTIYYSLYTLQQQYKTRPDIVAINLYQHGRYRMAMHFWKQFIKEIGYESTRCGMPVSLSNHRMWRLLVQHAAV